MTEQKNVKFGDILHSLRERQSISQNALARRSGVVPTTINRIERNRQGTPRTGTIVKLCKGLGYEIQDENCQQLLDAGRITNNFDTNTSTYEGSISVTPNEFTIFDAQLSAAEFKIRDAMASSQRKLTEALQEIQMLRAGIRNKV